MGPLSYKIAVFLLESIISCIFVFNSLKRKYHPAVQLGVWLSTSLVVLVLSQFSFAASRIVMVISELLMCCLLWKDKPLKCMGAYALKEGVRLFSAALTYSISKYFNQSAAIFIGAFQNLNSTAFLLYLVVYSVLSSILLQMMKGKKGAEGLWIVGTQLVLMLGESAALVAMIIISKTGIALTNTPLVLVAVFCMIATNVSIGILFTYLLQKISLADNMIYGHELSNMEYKYYEMSVENEKKIQLIRHDISNQIQTAYAMFQNGEHQRGVDFINHLQSEYMQVEPMVYCSNPLVNIIVANKKCDAENKGIEFQARIRQDLENLPISDFDLSTVICNLLDNAISGCEASGQNSPKLTIELLEKKQYLVIRVLNSCKVSMNVENTDRLKTTKNGSRSHGLGMLIISGIANKYRGDFVASAKNGLFTATVVLSLKHGMDDRNNRQGGEYL